jgi:hypothetical protein
MSSCISNVLVLFLQHPNSCTCGWMVFAVNLAGWHEGIRLSKSLNGRLRRWSIMRPRDYLLGLHSTCHNTRHMLRLRISPSTWADIVRTVHNHLQVRQKKQETLSAEKTSAHAAVLSTVKEHMFKASGSGRGLAGSRFPAYRHYCNGCTR